jgi:hypothetical protein
MTPYSYTTCLTETESQPLISAARTAKLIEWLAKQGVNMTDGFIKTELSWSTVFWDVTSYSFVEVCRRFGGTYCLHL